MNDEDLRALSDAAIRARDVRTARGGRLAGDDLNEYFAATDAFIRGVMPDDVLALLDRAQAAEARLAKAREALENLARDAAANEVPGPDNTPRERQFCAVFAILHQDAREALAALDEEPRT